MGAGRTELLECLFGLHGHACTGDVFIGGCHALLRTPAEAIPRTSALAPEDRKRDGLVLSMSVVGEHQPCQYGTRSYVSDCSTAAAREQRAGLLAAVPREDPVAAAADP